MLRRCEGWVVLAAALSCLPVSAAQKAEDEDRKLQGVWVCQSLTVNGKALPKGSLENCQRYFSNGRWGFRLGGTTTRGTYTLDLSGQHKGLVFQGDDGSTQGAIYELDGDRLKMCINSKGKDKPTQLAAKAGTGWALMVLKRQTP